MEAVRGDRVAMLDQGMGSTLIASAVNGASDDLKGSGWIGFRYWPSPTGVGAVFRGRSFNGVCDYYARELSADLRASTLGSGCYCIRAQAPYGTVTQGRVSAEALPVPSTKLPTTGPVNMQVSGKGQA